MVVGSQSSGKSSVLENIVGRDLYATVKHLPEVPLLTLGTVFPEAPELLQDDP